MAVRRVSLALAICVLALSACGSSAKQAAAPAAPATTTSTTDPYAVPATIDAAYMNKVLAAINHVRGDVRRNVYGTQSLSQSSKDKLSDIYADLALKGETQIFSDASATPDPNLKATPGDEVETVQKILVTKPGCVVVLTSDDENAELKVPKAPSGPWVIGLWAFPGTHGSNPTPWKEELIVHNGSAGSDYAC